MSNQRIDTQIKYWSDRITIVRVGWIVAISIIVVGILFLWPFTGFDIHLPIDNARFGNYGDFLAGTLGGILSLIGIVFVIRTFQHQQKVSELQRFNDIFFEMLSLYHQDVEKLHLEDYEENIYTGKDFFHAARVGLQDSFVAKDKMMFNILNARRTYLKFYFEHRRELGAYFRTLYRIYDLIDKSKIDNESKRDYLKIIRAQLSDSELFMLRYNAMTPYGKNFRQYICKYNVLKHLPPTTQLEFSKLRRGLNKMERMGADLLFLELAEALDDTLKGRKTDDYATSDEYHSNAFNVNILLIDNGNQVKTTITYNPTHPVTRTDFKFLCDIPISDVEWVLREYMREIFIYRSFESFNPRKLLEIKSYSKSYSFSAKKGNKKYTGWDVTVKVRRQDGKRLRLHHPDLDDVYATTNGMEY